MRTLLNTLAMLLAAAAGIAVFLWCIRSVGSNQSVLLVLGLVAGAVVVALWSSALLLHSLHVRLTRGSGFVSWVRPGACRSFMHWVASGWTFFSEGGRQEGFRFLGFEVAQAGRL